MVNTINTVTFNFEFFKLKLFMLDVSCIYVNYNSASYTIAAVKSLIDKTDSKVEYEIIVVDNGSNPTDYMDLVQGIDALENKRIKVYRSRINTGFGGGNMMGVNYASTAHYYAFINNDTLFTEENTLLDLKTFMDENSQVGVCGPQMMSEDGDRIPSIDHQVTPARQLLKKDVLEWLRPSKYPKRKKVYDTPVACGYVPGSFMMVSTSCFNAVGGFDTSLFLYYEESDLSRRIDKQLGKKTYYYPGQSYIHYQGKSTRKNIQIKIEQKISLLYLIHKHHGRCARSFLLAFYTIKYLFGAIYSSEKRQMFIALCKGAHISQSLRCQQEIAGSTM